MPRSSLHLSLFFWILCKSVEVQGTSVELLSVHSGVMQHTLAMTLLVGLGGFFHSDSDDPFNERGEETFGEDLSLVLAEQGHQSIQVSVIVCPSGSQTGSSEKIRGVEVSSEGSNRGSCPSCGDAVAGRCSGIAGAGGEEPPDDNDKGDKPLSADEFDVPDLICVICGEACQRNGLRTSCCDQLVCEKCRNQWHESRCMVCCSRNKPKSYCGINRCRKELTGLEPDQVQSHLLQAHSQSIACVQPCCQHVLPLGQSLPPDHAFTHHSHSVVTGLDHNSVVCSLSYCWMVNVPVNQVQSLPAGEPLPQGAVMLQPIVGMLQPIVGMLQPIVGMLQPIVGILPVQHIVFVCDLCQFVSYSPQTHSFHMYLHMLNVYSQALVITCPHDDCQYQTGNIMGLGQHFQNHHMLFICPFYGCSAAYNQERRCQNHFNRCHGKYVGED